jgi:hypothetical protein
VHVRVVVIAVVSGLEAVLILIDWLITASKSVPRDANRQEQKADRED